MLAHHVAVLEEIRRLSEEGERGLRVVIGQRHDRKTDEVLATLVLEGFVRTDLSDEDLQLRGIERHHTVHELHDPLLGGLVGRTASPLDGLHFLREGYELGGCRLGVHFLVLTLALGDADGIGAARRIERKAEGRGLGDELRGVLTDGHKPLVVVPA